jgi:hypothetical protein
MILFRIVAFASPLFLGFLLPFTLALGREKQWSLRKRAAAAALTPVFWLLLLFLLWSFSGDRISRFLQTAAFLLAFSSFLIGLFHLIVGFRLPPAVAQIFSGLMVVLMVGTLFYFDPILERSSAVQLPDRVALALEWNPYAVMAYSIFEEDVLTRRILYTRTLLADLQHGYPDWTRAALGYVLLGFWLYVGSLGLLALRMKFRVR